MGKIADPFSGGGSAGWGIKKVQDKENLASLVDEGKQAVATNARFFDSVEGMFSLNQENAVKGLYVATKPYLHLARAEI